MNTQGYTAQPTLTSNATRAFKLNAVIAQSFDEILN
jgi:hypothetical protein